VLLPSRFTGPQLALAFVAGVGIGVLAGTQLHKRGGSSPAPQPEPLSIPALGTGESAATNIFNPPGINPKIDETIPSNLMDLEPAKSRK
jgi:hypothetical protein